MVCARARSCATNLRKISLRGMAVSAMKVKAQAIVLVKVLHGRDARATNLRKISLRGMAVSAMQGKAQAIVPVPREQSRGHAERLCRCREEIELRGG